MVIPSNSNTSIDRRAFLHAAAGVVAASTVRLADAADTPAGKDPLLISENPVIVQARNSALAILKPSQVDLQHGLELHRQSLVFDSYGFAPRAAPDNAALAAADAAGATDAELQDLREEMGMIRAVTDLTERAEFAEAMRCSGVTCIFQNAGTIVETTGAVHVSRRYAARSARASHNC